MAYLVSKLIAGHTQDNKPLVCVATVELVHLSVVPGCCSSERRHIFNQHHFPFQRRETERFSRQQLGRQVVELLHPPSHCFAGRNVEPERNKQPLCYIRFNDVANKPKVSHACVINGAGLRYNGGTFPRCDFFNSGSADMKWESSSKNAT